jgi:hypothetical protein
MPTNACICTSVVPTDQLAAIAIPARPGVRDEPLLRHVELAPRPPVRRPSPLAFCKSLTGALYLDKPNELAAYEDVWASLDGHAPNERQLKEMINQIVGEIRHD